MPPLTEFEHAELRKMEKELRGCLSSCSTGSRVVDPDVAFEYARTYAVRFYDYYHAYYSAFSEDQTYGPHLRPASEKLAYQRVCRCIESYSAYDIFLLQYDRSRRLKKTISEHADLADDDAPNSSTPLPADEPLTVKELRTLETLIEQRTTLLEQYKQKTGASNRKIYEARNSGIYKPEFLRWQKGILPSSSATTANFERFLREMKPPIPRERKS